MQNFFLLGMVFAGTCVLPACSEDETNGANGTGELNVTLATDAGVNAVTKADTEQDSNAPGLGDFTISINGSVESKTLSYGEWNDPVELKEGAYTVTAISGEPAKEGFVGEDGYEKPWYQAYAEITIKGGETVPVNLSATLQNAKVSVEYTQDFVEYFKNHTTNISLQSSKGTRYFVFDVDQVYQPLYLIPGILEVNVEIADGGGIITGYPIQKQFTISAQTHYILTFGVDAGPTGDATLNITFADPETEDLGEINLGE